MNSSNAWCFGILAVFVSIASVSGLKCYNCALNCNDPFDKGSASIVNCDGSCLKTKSDGNVVRICSPTSLGDTCDKKDGIEGCSCTSDLCNSASGTSFFLFIFLSPFVFMFLWMK